MFEQMHEINFEQLDDGTIFLQQCDYDLRSQIINLHPCQIRYIAERAGLLEPTTPMAGLPATLLLRSKALLEHIGELYFDAGFADDILNHCESGAEIMLHLRMIYERSDELMLDIAAGQSEQKTTSNGNDNQISVTPKVETRKPGRPPTGTAMSNAERQKAHRERQKGALPVSC